MSNRAQRRRQEKLQHKEAGRAKQLRSSQSPQHRPAVSPSHAQPADDAYAVAVLNEVDNFAPLRSALKMIGDKEQSWAGIPMPITGYRMVIEPHYPRAAALAKIGVTKEMEQTEAEALVENDGWKIRNRFWSHNYKRRAVVIEDPSGRVKMFWDHGSNPLDRMISTMDLSSAWGIEQESRAVHTLGTLLRHHTFKTYLMTGMFIEKSKRSGLFYVFRKLRPTVVIDPTDMTIRCTLCMHPIAYYEDTWAGAMCPTDDVIAHLMLMRGDEPMFWRRANQHPAWAPESGIHL